MSYIDPSQQLLIDRERQRREVALSEARRLLGEHGMFTLQLVEWRETGACKQFFGSLNSVDNDTAKQVARHFLEVRYNAIEIEFRQNKEEYRASVSDRKYFHANFKRGPVDSEEGDQ